MGVYSNISPMLRTFMGGSKPLAPQAVATEEKSTSPLVELFTYQQEGYYWLLEKHLELKNEYDKVSDLVKEQHESMELFLNQIDKLYCKLYEPADDTH
jgi:hypothetical protein